MEDVVHYMAILSILQLFGIIFGNLVNYWQLGLCMYVFGLFYPEKSGNPLMLI
jgi:hypothetical protein